MTHTQQLAALFRPGAHTGILGILCLVPVVITYSVLVNSNSGTSFELVRALNVYGIAACLLLVAALWTLLLSIGVILNGLERLGTPTRISLQYGLAVLSVGLCVAGLYISFGGQGLSTLPDNVFPTVVNRLTGVMNFLVVYDVIGLCGATYVIASVNESDAVEVLAHRTRCLSILARSTAALLAASVFEVYALYSLGSKSAVAGSVSDDLKAHALPMAISAGVLGCLVLIVTYIPAAWLLNEALYRRFAEFRRTHADVSMVEWLARNGLSTLPLGNTTNYATMLIPLAAGILTKVLDHLQQ